MGVESCSGHWLLNAENRAGCSYMTKKSFLFSDDFDSQSFPNASKSGSPRTEARSAPITTK
ncbi:predicted protein [Chaetomium globosum CBS 148.51]|uniref:Uncharacterized protein n=1 Tax=Chaetomium globosum (strain ATCC 6205 / CBS 148.51 / DSM 1962 / NBRC 6347 / NRRL 1970) TaxID=306901 RepID=Q2HBR8_CHAGB|nr:uncharacterized protein CHGG_02336 [Chaetomium globosum CBS 148.51]EAQ90401.1 predicted protein [Chaetomium globosum CBS 148.51]